MVLLQGPDFICTIKDTTQREAFHRPALWSNIYGAVGYLSDLQPYPPLYHTSSPHCGPFMSQFYFGAFVRGAPSLLTVSLALWDWPVWGALIQLYGPQGLCCYCCCRRFSCGPDGRQTSGKLQSNQQLKICAVSQGSSQRERLKWT